MTGRHPLQIFVLIDGLGWQILEGREFLSDLLPYRAPLRTVLGYSSGAIPTILTGKSPAEHGHWNLVYHDPEGSPFRWLRHLEFLPNAALDNRVTRKLLKEIGRRVLGLGPLFECCVTPRLLSRFNWVEKRNIYDLRGIAGAPSIFDQLALSRVPFRVYSYHHYTDAEILRKAAQDVAAREADFLFLYLSQLDGYLHSHVHDDDLVTQRVAWYASGLRRLFQETRHIDAEACFTIISDHGMTPVRHHYDLAAEIESLKFSMPADYMAVYDSTMARFWFSHSDVGQEITEHLCGLPCGRMLPDNELQELGILFPDRRFGQLIFLLNPSWLVARSGFNGSAWRPAGMHGYHPDDPHSDAVFLSSHQPPLLVHTIADAYVCMQHAAALPVHSWLGPQ
jgi:Type I phosphodiesterase / nucleotide pyrophosphatase